MKNHQQINKITAKYASKFTKKIQQPAIHKKYQISTSEIDLTVDDICVEILNNKFCKIIYFVCISW